MVSIYPTVVCFRDSQIAMTRLSFSYLYLVLDKPNSIDSFCPYTLRLQPIGWLLSNLFRLPLSLSFSPLHPALVYRIKTTTSIAIVARIVVYN